MDRLFLDANIFFSATKSKSGGSNYLFQLAEKKKVKLFSSEYALKEAHRNIERKIGEEGVITFYKLVSQLEGLGSDHEVISSSHYQEYAGLIVEKDLPILVGAHEMKVGSLITLDQKDFKTEKLSRADLPFKIETPGEYLQRLV